MVQRATTPNCKPAAVAYFTDGDIFNFLYHKPYFFKYNRLRINPLGKSTFQGRFIHLVAVRGRAVCKPAALRLHLLTYLRSKCCGEPEPDNHRWPGDEYDELLQL